MIFLIAEIKDDHLLVKHGKLARNLRLALNHHACMHALKVFLVFVI